MILHVLEPMASDASSGIVSIKTVPLCNVHELVQRWKSSAGTSATVLKTSRKSELSRFQAGHF